MTPTLYATAPQAPDEARRPHLSGPPAPAHRLVAAMRELAAEHGWQRVTIEQLCAAAQVSRRTFYLCFRDAEDCFAGAVEEALDALCDAVSDAVRAQPEPWARRAAAGVAEIFAVFSEDQALAWLCVIEPLHGSERALAARRAANERLAALIGEPPQAGQGGSAAPQLLAPLWGMVQQHLLDGDALPLEEAVSSAIYLTLVPFVGRADAVQEARAAVPALRARPRRRSVDQTLASGLDLAGRDVDALLHLHRAPGASNADLARAIGDRHDSQISRRMAGLRKAGLVRRDANGRHAAWKLTPKGREIVTQLEPEDA